MTPPAWLEHGGGAFDGDHHVLYWADALSEMAFVVPSAAAAEKSDQQLQPCPSAKGAPSGKVFSVFCLSECVGNGLKGSSAHVGNGLGTLQSKVLREPPGFFCHYIVPVLWRARDNLASLAGHKFFTFLALKNFRELWSLLGIA